MDEERSREVGDVIRKGVALLAAMALVIAGGTWLLVHALGLNDGGDAGAVVGTPEPVTPLPSTALPVPDDSASPDDSSGATDESTVGTDDDGDDTGSDEETPGRPAAPVPRLAITPSSAAPMERLNLTGTYPGHDNVSLQVQRLEGGTWADFPTQARVNMGTFETYVMTSRTGPNKFRVYDPKDDRASNVVTIRID